MHKHPADKKIVIAVVNGELVVKRIRKVKNKLYLVPDNSLYDTLEIDEHMEFQVWGVVTSVIHAV